MEDNETADTGNTSAEDSFDGDITLDDLLNIDEEQYPEFKAETSHAGMKPLHHWLQHVPEDVRKHIANIRSDYTRKTQEIATMRKSLQDKESEILGRDRHLVDGQLAASLKDINTEEQYDLFDPEGMKSEIQRQAKLMLAEMLKPAQEELQVKARKVELENFKAANPELGDPAYRSATIALLGERPDLSFEDAFFITKAKLDSKRSAEDKARGVEAKTARRDTAMKSSVGTRAAPQGTPKFASGVEAYKWHKANGGNK